MGSTVTSRWSDLLAFSALALVCLAASAQPAWSASPSLVAGRSLPLSFEANQGQCDPEVRFVARGHGYGVFLTATDLVVVLTTTDAAPVSGRRPTLADGRAAPPAVVKVRLLGAAASAAIEGLEPLSARNNYLVGDRSRWRRNVPTFGRVRYRDLYPGISLVFYGHERALEYDFVVAPGADPSSVALAIDGVDTLRLDDSGDLVLVTAAGELRLRRPVIYQEVEGRRRPVDGGYVVDGRRVGFRVAAWDHDRPLVIDPILAYSTYLGGASNDQAFGIAVDGAGNAYVTGSTISSDFPVSAPLQPGRAGVTDAFVSKLDPSGTTLLYSTFLGGSGDDAGHGIAVDAAGSAYVAGATTSSNFPVANAFQATTRGGSEAFVAKLSPDGSGLVYSTYLGSNTDDAAFAIAVDVLGNAYVTGVTASASFPNNNAVACHGVKRTGNDAFVLRLEATGAVGFCTFIGGAGDDVGTAIAVHPRGFVWVGGSTTSADLPVVNASQRSLGGRTDGFVALLAGPTIVALTYLGGSNDDEVLGIAVDIDGNAYVTGVTTSSDFPTVAARQPTLAGGSDAFVTKLSSPGTTRIFSTYLGGSGDDVGNGIAVNPLDNTIYVTGSTRSPDFPLAQPIQGHAGGGLDAFLTKLTSSGTGLVYSTYLGGTADDVGQAIAVDTDGVAYVTGSTRSAAFPTVTPIQGPAGLTDAFVSQVSDRVLVEFTAATYQVAHRAGLATISVRRVGDVGGVTTVQVATVAGTAVAGVDYVDVPPATLAFAPGQRLRTFTVPILDDRACDGDETVQLQLTSAGGGAVLGARSAATLVLRDLAGCVNFSTSSFSVFESQGAAVITLTRSGTLSGVATARFTASAGTAVAGVNFVPVSRTVTFAPGVASVTVPVTILRDFAVNGTRSVNLALQDVGGSAVLGSRARARLDIVDADSGGAMQFAAAVFDIAENAGQAVIRVTRTAGTGAGATVQFATSDGTARAGVDYTPVSGTLTFARGETTKTFAVPITNDAIANGVRTVNLTLSSPGPNATTTLGARRTAVLRIVDDEPSLGFSATTYSVANGADAATITVQLTGQSRRGVSVRFSSADGTARAGIDYRSVAGVLTFPPGGAPGGIRTRTFVVPLLRGPAAPGTVTVSLALTDATGAVLILGPPSGASALLVIGPGS